MDTDELSIFKREGANICIVDSVTIHTILQNKKYFLNLLMTKVKVNIISSPTNLIEGSGRVIILLTNGTKLCINSTLYSSRFRRNLLSFKDIYSNGYHIETTNEKNIEYLYITRIISDQKFILEKLKTFSFGLYYTIIRLIETYITLNQKLSKPIIFQLWHDRLGHPESTMMHRIIKNSHGHPLNNMTILSSNENICTICS